MPSGPTPPPAPSMTPGRTRWAGMCGGALWVSPSSTTAAASRFCGMCSMWMTRAASRRPVPGCGNMGRNTPGRCRRRWSSDLTRRPETAVCRSSWNRSRPSLRRNIGTSIKRTSSTSLTAVSWGSMLSSASERSSEVPPPSAWLTSSCPGVGWKRRTILPMRTF